MALLASGACSSDAARRAPMANVITVHGADFSYDARATIPAGITTANFVNDGPSLHQAQIVRLDSGKTITDLKTAFEDARSVAYLGSAAWRSQRRRSGADR